MYVPVWSALDNHCSSSLALSTHQHLDNIRRSLRPLLDHSNTHWHTQTQQPHPTHASTSWATPHPTSNTGCTEVSLNLTIHHHWPHTGPTVRIHMTCCMCGPGTTLVQTHTTRVGAVGHSLVSCAVSGGVLECCHHVVQWTQAAGLSRSPVVRYWLTCGLLMNMFRQNKRWVIPFVVSV